MCGTILNRALLLIFSILLIASQQAAAQAGHLDPTFGNGGIVTTDFGDQSQSSNAGYCERCRHPGRTGKLWSCGGVPGQQRLRSSRGRPLQHQWQPGHNFRDRGDCPPPQA